MGRDENNGGEEQHRCHYRLHANCQTRDHDRCRAGFTGFGDGSDGLATGVVLGDQPNRDTPNGA